MVLYTLNLMSKLKRTVPNMEKLLTGFLEVSFLDKTFET